MPGKWDYPFRQHKTFNVSTDFLLGMEETATVSVKGLSQRQVAVVIDMIQCFQNPD